MIDIHLAALEHERQQPPAVATLVFGGDLYVPCDAPFPAISERVRRWIAEADVAVVNLEAPLASAPAPIPKAGPHLMMSPAVARELRSIGFDVCSLANNHLMDHGWQGAQATHRACAAAALRTVGVGASLAEARAPCLIDLPGAGRIALFAACENEFGTAGKDSPGTAPISDPGLLSAIAEAARDAVVVVMAHGGNEVVPVPSSQRRAQLRMLIDAGASLIVGHHPHVAQGWETYREGVIFYSLGDFLFGTDVPRGHREQWSFLVRAGIDEDKVEWVQVAAVERDDQNVEFVAAGDARHGELEALSEIAGSPELEAYWQEAALMLHEERYRPFLRQALGVSDPPPATLAQRALGLLPVRRASQSEPDDDAAVAARAWSEALLLVLLRCESHRWAMETASGVLSGDLPDRRTAAISRRVRELVSQKSV